MAFAASPSAPEAWRGLAEKGDEMLVEILASAVKSKAGVRSEGDDVAEFLAVLGRAATMAPHRPTPMPPPTSVTTFPVPPRPQADSPRSGRLTLKGKAYSYSNAKDAMLIVLRELAKLNPTFLERCPQYPHAPNRKHRYLARSTEELYPNGPDLRKYQDALPKGRLVATNLNNVLKKNIIRLAAEVAGISFENDLTVQF